MMIKKFSETIEAQQLKTAIDEWRKNKSNPKMPEALWIRAAEQAKLFGLSAVAGFLRLGRIGLKKRISPSNAQPKQVARKGHGFVRLPNIAELPKACGLELHLMSREGEKACVRGVGSSTEWADVFTGWLKASRLAQQEAQS